ncbi:PREDICTED: uncharacterized protein LOC104607149 [Nelumbo nucifera]|uniref:Uncharacterized protein LOC104607149 n=1 Tax=Nelumbo nucifera TaxID=4432 RepID=A0A1U8AT36_NELNU|nr:PREDICTED: uncharacterized protein LOC104607149 [Nelumbo nucifera]
MKRDQLSSECGGCGSEERWLLHNVRHRGIYRRLCTSCVLKFHGGSFCPHCFEVYEGSLPPHERVMCLKCPSVAHLACVGIESAPRYVCPTCLNPAFLFFEVGASSKKIKVGEGDSANGGGRRVLDQKSAKVFLASAKIAAVSMSKAAAVARIEAERRVKEASVTKKRAREALERVAFLVAKEKEKDKDKEKEKEKEKEKDKEKERGKELARSMVEQKKKPKGNTAVTAAVAAHKRIQSNPRAGGNGKPGGVLVHLNDIGSSVKERLTGTNLSTVVLGLPKNGVSIGNKDKQKVVPGSGVVHQQLQNHASVKENDKLGSMLHLQNHNIQVEKEKNNNGVLTVPPVVGQLQHPQHDNGVEEERGQSGLVDSELGSRLPQSNQDKLAAETISGFLLTGSSNAAG